MTPPAVLTYLRTNLEAMVASAVLKDGKSEGQARGELEGVLAAVGLFKDLEIRTQPAGERGIALDFRLDLEPQRNR